MSTDRLVAFAVCRSRACALRASSAAWCRGRTEAAAAAATTPARRPRRRPAARPRALRLPSCSRTLWSYSSSAGLQSLILLAYSSKYAGVQKDSNGLPKKAGSIACLCCCVICILLPVLCNEFRVVVTWTTKLPRISLNMGPPRAGRSRSKRS